MMVAMSRLLAFLASLPERLVRSRRRAARRGRARDGFTRAATVRPPLAPLRGDGEERAADHDRARRRRRRRLDGRARRARAGELAMRRARATPSSSARSRPFGFSPLWLLAAASDVLHGTRVYLDALVDELQHAGVLARESHFETVDDLLGALQGDSGDAARLIDIPPLALSELRRRSPSCARAPARCRTRGARARLRGLRREAARERRSVLEVSSGIGLAFVARGALGRPRPRRGPVPGGLAAAPRRGLRRVRAPRRRPVPPAVAAHFDPGARRSPSAASPAYVHDPEEGSHSFEGVRPSIRAPTMCPCGSLPRCGATGATSSPTPAFGTSRLSVCA